MPVKKHKDILHKAANLSFPIFLLLCLDSNFSSVFFSFLLIDCSPQMEKKIQVGFYLLQIKSTINSFQ